MKGFDTPMSDLSYVIPTSLNDEITELEKLIGDFQNKAISETELKARRVLFGVYEQRLKGTFMVRVRCTAGIIMPKQLKKVAELSLRFASGSLHLTTRQEIQIHDVALQDLIPIIRGLIEVGLATRGGGGNTVRNITAPWNSGIALDEIFDVTPYAIALTSALIARGDSWQLPRKYKIAFSHSESDTGFATVNDLGFIAQIKDGVEGFKVFVAGGMGRQSQPGHVLHDFVPGSQILLVAEAVKRVFSKFGNRKNKHAARLRFLWNSLGRDQFIRLYETEKQELAKEGFDPFETVDINNTTNVSTGLSIQSDNSIDYSIWEKRYVNDQKQAGLHCVKIPVLFGMISADKARELAQALIPFGENTIRFTHDQNIALRNIPVQFLGNIYSIAKKASELSNGPALFGDAVACAGASTCRLGICRSRGALEAVIDCFKTSPVNLDNLNGLRIHVSGCSNTCGQHMIADLGFFGKVGRQGQHSYPTYTIVAGARLQSDGTTKLAEKIDDVNAHDLPAFVEELLSHFGERKLLFTGFNEYLNKEGKAHIQTLCDKYRNIPSFDVDGSYYRDWGETETGQLPNAADRRAE